MTVMPDQVHSLTNPPCLQDPDRWCAGGEDPELKALCRRCPRRWVCANEALHTTGVQGMWSGVNVPAEGRGRTFALRQLRSLATCIATASIAATTVPRGRSLRFHRATLGVALVCRVSPEEPRWCDIA